MERYFQTTPPAVHEMVKTLHSRGFISREPGKPRTIRVLLPREELPDLEGRKRCGGIQNAIGRPQVPVSLVHDPIDETGKIGHV
jgi:repressor LexA